MVTGANSSGSNDTIGDRLAAKLHARSPQGQREQAEQRQLQEQQRADAVRRQEELARAERDAALAPIRRETAPTIEAIGAFYAWAARNSTTAGARPTGGFSKGWILKMCDSYMAPGYDSTRPGEDGPQAPSGHPYPVPATRLVLLTNGRLLQQVKKVLWIGGPAILTFHTRMVRKGQFRATVTEHRPEELYHLSEYDRICDSLAEFVLASGLKWTEADDVQRKKTGLNALDADWIRAATVAISALLRELGQPKPDIAELERNRNLLEEFLAEVATWSTEKVREYEQLASFSTSSSWLTSLVRRADELIAADRN